VPPGIIFCLRAEGEAAGRAFEPGYPLAPHYLVHVAADGAVLLRKRSGNTATPSPGPAASVCGRRHAPGYAASCPRILART